VESSAANSPTQQRHVIAIDIGGTKVAGCIVHADGSHTPPIRLPTDADTPRGPWNAVAALLTELSHAADGPLAGVGVATAGPIDTTGGTVSPVMIPPWRRFPLPAHIAAHLRALGHQPAIPVQIIGDATAFTTGEHWKGAGQVHTDMIGIVVSTGVGAGIIQQGRLVTGRSGNAGHLGHIIVDINGQPCPCGSTGCVETIASGPAMVRWALAHGWTTTSSTPDAAALAQDAHHGDATAIAAFDRGTRALAAGIVSAAALTDINHIVIGGGVSHADRILFEPLERHVKRHAGLTYLRDLRVVRAANADTAGLLGAAACIHRPDRYGIGAVLATRT
jgi:glucokinase